MPNDIASLITRIEAAEGPDGLMDRDIAEALGLGPDETWERLVSRPGIVSMDENCWVKANRLRRAKPYTASLDAAMTLVPDGWSWSLGEQRGVGTFRGWLNDHNTPDGLAVRHVDAEAATPALALTAACLRAMQDQAK